MQRMFRALAETIVPEAKALDGDGWRELEAIVENGLASRPQSVRRQFRLFVAAINLLPLFRFGRTFRGLNATRRTAFLHGLENAPLLLVRRGFWGVRTLIFMGYYGRDAARDAIGYRADIRGWEARR